MEKALLIICDGLGDRPVPSFDRKTPLEVAHTPNLDYLAKRGITGVMHTIDIGVRPGSDTAHLALFGYDPHVYYTGRGPFETAGIGMKSNPGNVCFRVNMGTVDEKGYVIDRRAGRIEDTGEFAELFDGTVIDGITFHLKKGTSYRIGMVMEGPGISAQVSDVDPHGVDRPFHKSEPLDKTPEAAKTAEVLNKFVELTQKKLDALASNKKRKQEGKLPANCFLIRGAGIYPDLPSFLDRYGLKASCVAGAGLYKGIGRMLGMDIVSVPGATGTVKTDISAKITAAIAELKTHDFVYVHIKGADSLGEDGNCKGKVAFIERMDEAFAPLKKLTGVTTVITADHSTPCTIKTHSADDVPILMHGVHVRDDEVQEFSERACANGRLGAIRGAHLMPILLDLIGIAQKFGA